MWHPTGALVCLLSVSSCAVAAAQTKPAAYIYVSSMYEDTNTQVVGFAASANGQLTPIAGSPWPDQLWDMAVNGDFLFGSDNVPNDNARNIYSYRIESNGALKYLGATDIEATGSDNGCNQGGDLVLDHSGSYLYSLVSHPDCNTGETAAQSFKVNWSTGLLNYVGESAPTALNLGAPLTLSANNSYAYDFATDGTYGYICGFRKGSNGALAAIQSNCRNNPMPKGVPSNWTEYQGHAAADTTNHLAMEILYWDPEGVPYTKIATYAIDPDTGALTTNSTFQNMPESQVQNVNWVAMSPSGKLFAVGGSNGMQIFNFNANGQATANTGMLTTAPITMMYWDNSNHLYAISNTDSTIHVFTVTPTSATEVPGSPWTVAHPVTMIVQPE